jgi:nucleoid DNA-binding protein
MMLEQYIQEVLFKQRVCVVPQLGTFSVQHFPAHYNTHAQTLTAPREQVMFTQQWQDDGSCVEWIALKENLVPAVAQRKLEKYLEELKDGLKSGTPLVLPGIGQLQGDFAGNIHFHAEELPIEKATLDLSPIERAESKPAAFTPPVPQPDPEQKQALEPIMTEEMEETLEAVTEESGFKWWWAALPIAAIVIGLAAWWYISGVSAVVSETAPSVNIDSVAQQAAIDSLQKVAIADSITAANAVHTYFAVIDTYKDSSKAVVQQKKQQGWKRTLIIYKRDSMFRTAVELHVLPIDTTQSLDSVKKIFGNKVRLEF